MIIEIEEKKYTVEVEETDVTVIVEETPVTVEITTGSYQGDATTIQGIPVSSGGIEDGQVLVYDEEVEQYQPKFIKDIRNSYMTGEAVGGHRAVILDNDLVFYVNNTNLTHADKPIGITTQAAILGAFVNVIFSGEIEENSWNWDITKPLYISTGGNLTQICPTSGFICIIATPITNKKILVLKETIIILK